MPGIDPELGRTQCLRTVCRLICRNREEQLFVIPKVAQGSLVSPYHSRFSLDTWLKALRLFSGASIHIQQHLQ